jgi:predicted DNA-binding WGR domain protein
LVLLRVDPEQGFPRFYSLMIKRDLFGTVRLVRNWGRIGTNGQELVGHLSWDLAFECTHSHVRHFKQQATEKFWLIWPAVEDSCTRAKQEARS